MNDPKRWRSRAEEARAIAGNLQDQEARKVMPGFARGYDRPAEHAEQRILTGSPHSE